MNASTSIKSVVLIALASVFATGVELAGIDSLATPRAPITRQAVVQLPTVVVEAQRDVAAVTEVEQLPTVVITAQRGATAVATVQQLPRVVIVGHRETQTALSARTVSEI